MLGHPNPHAPARARGPRPHPAIQCTNHDVWPTPIALTIQREHAPLPPTTLSPRSFHMPCKRPFSRPVPPHPPRRFQGFVPELNPAHQRFMRAPHGPSPDASLVGLSLKTDVPILPAPNPHPCLHQAAVLGMLPSGEGVPLPFPLSPTSLIHPLNHPMGASGPAERRAQEPSLRGRPSPGQLPVHVVFLGRPIHAQTRILTLGKRRDTPGVVAPPARHPTDVASACRDAMGPRQTAMFQRRPRQGPLELCVMQSSWGEGQLHFGSPDKQGQAKRIGPRQGQSMAPAHLVVSSHPGPTL